MRKLTDRAYEQIKAAIFDGRLPPGAPLSRRRLAEELAMSLAPVGDALERLAGERLVESKPRAGTRVRLATPDEVRGNYVLREALETHSARLFAESASAKARRQLLAHAAKLDADYARPKADAAQVERRHVAFHLEIARAGGVPELTEAIERSRVLLFNWLFSTALNRGRLPAAWHLDLAERLVKSPPAEAAEAMRRHVRFRQEEVIAGFKDLALSPPRMVRGPQRRPYSSAKATKESE